jgi:hypothetical protein
MLSEPWTWYSVDDLTFQHPTPYSDDSYGINSANAGPYGDAIIGRADPLHRGALPRVRQPYARVLAGGSTGGWGSLALQVYHPNFFGGTCTFYPAPVEFRRYYGGLNLYEDSNAFTMGPLDAWVIQDRYLSRSQDGQVQLSNRQYSRFASVLGTQTQELSR